MEQLIQNNRKGQNETQSSEIKILEIAASCHSLVKNEDKIIGYYQEIV